MMHPGSESESANEEAPNRRVPRILQFGLILLG